MNFILSSFKLFSIENKQKKFRIYAYKIFVFCHQFETSVWSFHIFPKHRLKFYFVLMDFFSLQSSIFFSLLLDLLYEPGKINQNIRLWKISLARIAVH